MRACTQPSFEAVIHLLRARVRAVRPCHLPFSADASHAPASFFDNHSVYYSYMKRTLCIIFLLVGILAPHNDLHAQVIDTDNDGAPDAWELLIGTDIANTDTDGDGFLDGVEILNGYNPTSPLPTKIPKRIVVTLKTQQLAYYFGEHKLDEFPISSGLARTPTPPGTYTVLIKRPVVNYTGVGYSYPNTKWNLMFKTHPKGNYYIHGAYWHNKFGTPRSHGCVNVSYANMERLYAWAEKGTPITVQ